MKNKTKSLIKRISCLVAVMCILGSLCIPCFASDSNIVNSAYIRTDDYDMQIEESDIFVESFYGDTIVKFDVAHYDIVGEFVCDFSPLTFDIAGMYDDRGIVLIHTRVADIMDGVPYDYVLTGNYHFDDSSNSEYLSLGGNSTDIILDGYALEYDSLDGWSTVTFDSLTLHVSSVEFPLDDIQVTLSSYYIPSSSGGDDSENEIGVLSSVLGVFDAGGTWIAEIITNLTPMFYTADSGLTFLGVLAVAGLAFSVILLVIGFISRFLRFGG